MRVSERLVKEPCVDDVRVLSFRDSPKFPPRHKAGRAGGRVRRRPLQRFARRAPRPRWPPRSAPSAAGRRRSVARQPPP